MELEASKPTCEDIRSDLSFQARTYPLKQCVMPHVVFFPRRLRLIASGLKTFRCRRQIHPHLAAFQFHYSDAVIAGGLIFMSARHGRSKPCRVSRTL
ncbi:MULTISPECIES: hypothetical protein [Sinorhizobium]|uniref:hypothetical protein n=1 Tax=Rhizobium meliloti TaxID=382 RepID=UPI001F218449|nr:hypothetical protein [Sinorhizobium sp. M4_45]